MNIKMVAVDVDGTFMRSDYTYDQVRFDKIFKKMKEIGCHFVVASGNQYYQLRDLFEPYSSDIGFVAENGAYIVDSDEVVSHVKFAQEVVDEFVDMFVSQSEHMDMVMCCAGGAYCQRGTVSEGYFEAMKQYCHRLAWVDDLKKVNDDVLKFAVNVKEEETEQYYELLSKKFEGKLEPTSSGHGAIDMILPHRHKAYGIKKLVERWNLKPIQCVAFGDGGNDIEMLKYVGLGIAMDNAPKKVKDAADVVCPSNNEDGVIVALEELLEV